MRHLLQNRHGVMPAWPLTKLQLFPDCPIADHRALAVSEATAKADSIRPPLLGPKRAERAEGASAPGQRSSCQRSTRGRRW